MWASFVGSHHFTQFSFLLMSWGHNERIWRKLDDTFFGIKSTFLWMFKFDNFFFGGNLKLFFLCVGHTQEIPNKNWQIFRTSNIKTISKAKLLFFYHSERRYENIEYGIEEKSFPIQRFNFKFSMKTSTETHWPKKLLKIFVIFISVFRWKWIFFSLWIFEVKSGVFEWNFVSGKSFLRANLVEFEPQPSFYLTQFEIWSNVH